jgi:hypothetical protein
LSPFRDTLLHSPRLSAVDLSVTPLSQSPSLVDFFTTGYVGDSVDAYPAMGADLSFSGQSSQWQPSSFFRIAYTRRVPSIASTDILSFATTEAGKSEGIEHQRFQPTVKVSLDLSELGTGPLPSSGDFLMEIGRVHE